MNEITYGILLKALQTWPLNRLILWKIKADAGFSIVEKVAAHLSDVPLHLPITLPSPDQQNVAKRALDGFNLHDFVDKAVNNEHGMRSRCQTDIRLTYFV